MLSLRRWLQVQHCLQAHHITCRTTIQEYLCRACMMDVQQWDSGARPCCGGTGPLFKEHLQGRGGSPRMQSSDLQCGSREKACGVWCLQLFGSKCLLDSLCMGSLEVITA